MKSTIIPTIAVPTTTAPSIAVGSSSTATNGTSRTCSSSRRGRRRSSSSSSRSTSNVQRMTSKTCGNFACAFVIIGGSAGRGHLVCSRTCVMVHDVFVVADKKRGCRCESDAFGKNRRSTGCVSSIGRLQSPIAAVCSARIYLNCDRYFSLQGFM